MSYCQCGGYLGSGGVDGYAGRWCRCTNPIQANPSILTTGANITLSGSEIHIKDDAVAELMEENQKLRKALQDIAAYGYEKGDRVQYEINLICLTALGEIEPYTIGKD